MKDRNIKITLVILFVLVTILFFINYFIKNPFTLYNDSCFNSAARNFCESKNFTYDGHSRYIDNQHISFNCFTKLDERIDPDGTKLTYYFTKEELKRCSE